MSSKGYLATKHALHKRVKSACSNKWEFREGKGLSDRPISKKRVDIYKSFFFPFFNGGEDKKKRKKKKVQWNDLISQIFVNIYIWSFLYFFIYLLSVCLFLCCVAFVLCFFFFFLLLFFPFVQGQDCHSG